MNVKGTIRMNTKKLISNYSMKDFYFEKKFSKFQRNSSLVNIASMKTIKRRNGLYYLLLGLSTFTLFAIVISKLRVDIVASNVDDEVYYHTDIVPFVKRNNSMKISWSDYEQIALNTKKPAMIYAFKPHKNTTKSHEYYNQLFLLNGYNGGLSDLLPLNRMLPDTRYELCKTMLYDEHLPSVSVIICFHNEHWSTLLRTLHSIFDRSPQHLLKELILVDDASTKDILKYKLSIYIKTVLPKVRLIRLELRSGLIHARLVGAKNATGDILLFMDPHCEVNVNWLPPLLEPIGNDYKKVVSPLIDDINAVTLEYTVQDDGRRGIFDWGFNYYRVALLKEDEKDLPKPFKTPVMAGMVFAISRYFFWMLDGYDDGLVLSGGENLELSFKIWQCGGSLYEVPCSRVGHLYRKFEPKFQHLYGGIKNFKRIVDAWMDSYPQVLDTKDWNTIVDGGDMHKPKLIREKYNCKSFEWYLTNIAFEVLKLFPRFREREYARGQIQSNNNISCIDAMYDEDGILYLNGCNATTTEQDFLYELSKVIRLHNRNVCLDRLDDESVGLKPCVKNQASQIWYYDVKIQQIFQNTFCLDANLDEHNVITISTCDNNSQTQKWHFAYIDYDLIKNRYHYNDDLRTSN